VREVFANMPRFRELPTSLRFAVALALLAAMAGCKATPPPGKAETAVAVWVKHHVTVGGRKDKNPLKADAATIADGKQLFNSECMVCHGNDGQNTGVPFAQSISPPIPSLASESVQSYTDGQLKWIIKNGLYPSGMPAANGDFGDDDEWRMVVYIRHLPPKGSLGEPAAYSGK
jgi:mono/diheme cytochrome c family protein